MTNASAKTKTKTATIERIRSIFDESLENIDLLELNQVANTLERVRKLMDKCQNVSSGEKLKKGDMAYYGSSNKKEPWITAMALKVAEMNACTMLLIQACVDNKVVVACDFYGVQENAHVCKLTLTYLIAVGRNSYEKNRKKLGLKGVRDKNNYLIGYAMQIRDHIDALIDAA